MPLPEKIMLRCVLLLALCAPLAGQSKPKLRAQSFHFDDYRTFLQLDAAALRDTGVWDELYVSGLEAFVVLVREQFGFDADHLDRLTLTGGMVLTGDDARAFEAVVVLEGNAELEPPGDLGGDSYELTTIGGHDVYTYRWGGDAFVAPTPKLQVYGKPALLRPVLEGRPRAGLPSPDVMAYTAGKQNTLLQWVVDLDQDPQLRAELQDFAEAELAGLRWPEADAPTTLAGRIAATGDEDDRHVLLEVVLRHGTAGDGLARSEEIGSAGIAALKKLPQARMFWSLLKRVEFERSGTDAVWRVDLGRARSVGGLLTTATPLLLLGLTTVRVVQQAVGQQLLEEVEEEVEPPPPPPPPPVRPPAGGGGR
jgi:hypothetical protein